VKTLKKAEAKDAGIRPGYKYADAKEGKRRSTVRTRMMQNHMTTIHANTLDDDVIFLN